MKWYLSIILLVIPFLLLADPVYLGNGQNDVSVLVSNAKETVLQYNIGHFNAHKIEIGTRQWHHLALPGEGVTQVKGEPELPVYNRSIIIPSASAMSLEIYDLHWEDIELAIAPSKGIITRDQTPDLIPYTFSDTYTRDEFYPHSIASLSEPYILREFRGITIQTTPFAYNPISGILRVYTAYKVRVSASGTDYRNLLSGERSFVSRDFLPIYENHFLNWDSERYTPVSDSFGKLLVICHTNYMTTIA
ncbi:MAG: C25 family peptidase propeptide domain-containing protein [Candidatus Cloacimonadota bacterium]